MLPSVSSIRGNYLKDAASTAYAKVFAPYHGRAIRKFMGAGMYALPIKAQLLRKLNEDGYPKASGKQTTNILKWGKDGPMPLDFYELTQPNCYAHFCKPTINFPSR